MSKYQISFLNSKGSGSFEYIEADDIESAKVLAVDKANEHLKEKRHWNKLMSGGWFYNPYVPIRTVKVCEIVIKEGSGREMTSRDGTKKTVYDWITKRGGNKFQLKLTYIEMKFSNGEVERNEWYQLKE